MPGWGRATLYRGLGLAAVGLCLAVAASCDAPAGDEVGGAASLDPAEIFVWREQPIELAPPAGWRREKQLSGGLSGVWFVKPESGGERIEVAEHHAVDKRDRCVELTELQDSVETAGLREFVVAVQRARPYAQPAWNGLESAQIELTSQSLDRALAAFRADDRLGAASELGWAREQMGRIRYSLPDLMDRITASARRNESLGPFQLGEPDFGELAGSPSVRLDYRLEVDGKELVGREIHVLHHNRLFVVGFQGFERSLPIFEALASTVRFPPGPCSH